jgi:hypothetical protein
VHLVLPFLDELVAEPFEPVGILAEGNLIVKPGVVLALDEFFEEGHGIPDRNINCGRVFVNICLQF